MSVGKLAANARLVALVLVRQSDIMDAVRNHRDPGTSPTLPAHYDLSTFFFHLSFDQEATALCLECPPTS
jgi:hypothetical protein